MVECFPKGIGRDANEGMGLSATGVLMPDGTQQEVGFQNPKGAFDNRELDIRLPELLGGPASLIAAQQIGAVAAQGLFEFGDVPGHVEVASAGAYPDGHERIGFGKTLFASADGFEDFVAFLEPAFGDAKG